jgi:hypothetical protein
LSLLIRDFLLSDKAGDERAGHCDARQSGKDAGRNGEKANEQGQRDLEARQEASKEQQAYAPGATKHPTDVRD